MYKGDITMTTNLIRKQIYINPVQQAKLHLLARRRGVSEAEVIREAIDHEAEITSAPAAMDSHAALDALLQAAAERRTKYGTDEPYHFNREEIYSERENRINDDMKEYHAPDSD
jgi:hypothetical protein